MKNQIPPQQDLFLAPQMAGLPTYRDDIDIMSLPFLCVEKYRTKPMESGDPNDPTDPYIKVTGADYGLATRYDGDFLIVLRTMIITAINNGESVSRVIRTTGYDLLKAARRGTSATEYKRLREALQKLKSTSITTNVTSGNSRIHASVSFIDRFTFIEKETARGMVAAGIEIEVSEWLFKLMADPKRSLAIDSIYFELTGGIQKALYGICRRHLGNQRVWCIGVDKLQKKIGASQPRHKFIEKLRQIAEEGIPGFHLELSDQVPDDAWKKQGAFSGSQVRPADLPKDTPGRPTIFIVRPAPLSQAA